MVYVERVLQSIICLPNSSVEPEKSTLAPSDASTETFAAISPELTD